MQNFIGKTIDRYRIDAEQGVGGMAVVYKAFDTRLEREVALKLIRTEQIPPIQLERILERFRREAKNLAKLTDVPGVVTLLDYGVYEQRPYMVMSFLPGGTLKDRLGKPIDPLEALEQLLPVAEALAIIHEMDIIHRDIKPSNLLINRFGKLALADFGIAKAFESGDATLTGTGMGVGTPEYMAPEQWTGKTTTQSDIYSLGVVYYEMITGKKPYEADTASELFLKIMTEPLKNPREIVGSIPEPFCQFLQKCMARDLRQRTQDLPELLSDIRGLMMGDQKADPGRVLGETAAPKPQEAPQPEPPLEPDATWDPVIESERKMPEIKSEPRPRKKPSLADGQIEVPLGEKLSITFLQIPAGNFLMGADKQDRDADLDEKPQHSVYLDRYWMAQTPVTNEQYKEYAENFGIKHIFTERKAKWPVVNLTWTQALQFCKWLSQKSGQLISLPTEAEWEKAARGTDGRLFPWGNDEPNSSLANYNHIYNEILPVGSFEQVISPYGILDMAGNVWEWTSDWYDEGYYTYSPVKNPKGPLNGSVRSVRGGALDLGERYLRVTYRDFASPDYKFTDLGFRCVIRDKV